MEFIKKRFKSMYRTSIIFSLILFFIGLFLLMKPETTLHAISYTVGLILILWGIIPIISSLTNKESQNYLEFGFIIGAFSLTFGIIIMINPTIIGSIIPFLIGTWMIINGITKLYYALTINKQFDALFSIILSLIILICGIILLFNPFGGAIIMTKLIGISIIIYSILDIIECYTLKKTVKKIINNKKEEKIIEAIYEEE